MTTLRRQRPSRGPGRGPRLGLTRGRSLVATLLWLLTAAVPAFLPWQAGQAATTEQIVADHNTGLAIFGYDPVSYFTDRAAKLGREDLELKHGGAAWRFRNEGNRDAFAADPDIYTPQYGGHDPVAIAIGIARAGHPDFWTIHKDRLFLFYSEDARKAFNADPEHMALQAEVNWPHVSQSLTP